jgi:hypothetical protein
MTDANPVYTFRVEILTKGLLIRGSYDMTIYRRLSDALNSDQHGYFVLRDATLAPLSHPNQIQHVPQLFVDRRETLIVATLAEPEPPADYYHSTEIERTPLQRDLQTMLFFTSDFALRAQFAKRPDISLMETLERNTDEFFPLTSVQVFPLTGVGQAANHSFVCLNRSHIIALCPVGGPALPSSQAEIAPTPLEAQAEAEAEAESEDEKRLPDSELANP